MNVLRKVISHYFEGEKYFIMLNLAFLCFELIHFQNPKS